ncbi:MAG: hypothetical protein ACYS76_15305 [Planctomycetota bacterium]
MKKKQQERYLRVPNHILNIPKSKLGSNPKLLLAHIYSFGRKGCWQSNETLGKMFFRSERTISEWVAELKKGGYILWLHPKGYYRTLWAKSHPEVRAAATLPCNDREVAKAEIISGQAKSTPLRNKLRGEYAENCEVSAQKNRIPLRRKLRHTNNTTNRDTTTDTSATPAPLPAGGQASALLEDRQKEKQARIERLKKQFGGGKQRGGPLSPEEFERRREQQKAALKGK